MKPRPEPFESSRKPRRPFPKPKPRKKQTLPTESGPIPKTSRQLAFYLLREGDLLQERDGGRRPEQYATERLEAAFEMFSLSPEERRLTQELLNGTIRRKGTLDFLLEACCQRPLIEIELELVWLMRLGVYQLLYLDSIPDHAALNETVDVARWYGKTRWCKFLNGNLRSVHRLLTEDRAPSPQADTFLTRNGEYRRITKPLFSDPEEAPHSYLSETRSFPFWLIERWSTKYALAELEQLCDWFNEPAPLYLRVNSLKTTRDELLTLFEQNNIIAEVGEAKFSIRLGKSYPVKTLPGYHDGLFSVQDETPQRVCALLDVQPGEIVWDMCAAPGTKSSCLAEAMQNQGKLLATDTNVIRLKRVRENAQRLGLSIIKSEVLPEEPPYSIKEKFDAILIDAPCSNTGVLGKRSEARWRLRPNDITELAKLQRTLLESALTYLKPGGRIVYSTCSIEPEENEQQVHSFLESHPQFQLQQEEHFSPGKPSDGGYAALLRYEG
ncbi:MAG: 16S rRNA (cytosine(967)-C(5))-methyltransferase RsmB [Planctomycetaceae bacterium]|nr:16S rRNA (cytosine(967)-C(5))-methyltransferase RsmB [Planctomycetaceae bacterium]